jgi:serine/threonine-protein kinase
VDRRRLADLFAEALEQPPGRRQLHLELAAADAPELREEVSRLLAAHERAGDFLSGLDAVRAAELLASVQAPGEGRRIGPYRVLRELGRGGMGTVYLAERADGGFEQRVALKLVKRGMDSEAIVERFRRERQILARLHHPHVARLYDGGVADDGRPWFAMEHVDGSPITRHCDERRLPVEARLELFQDVCRAVQYAHGNLVVHRDLKPSNVLVSAAGEVKLLDFGIARLLDDADEGGRQLTVAGARAMTPDYAAPEQLAGGPVTTAADVYALGVILYELLSGHLPHPPSEGAPGLVAGAPAAAEPERPSAAAGRPAERDGRGHGASPAPQRIAAARGTTPERLRRRLAGDLDAVVLEALECDPERRYPSAEALLRDLERHLAGKPVLAHRDSFGYRAYKFVRRHVAAVSAAAAFVLLLAAASAALLVQQARTARERDKAREVKELVLGLFAVSDPGQGRGETVTARELLDRGAERIPGELAGQPEVRAEMMAVVGEIYRRLGLYDAARPLLEGALALRRHVLGARHADVAESLGGLARLAYDSGRYADAEPLYREALALQRQIHGATHPEVARSLDGLSVVVRVRRRLDEAESLAREALAMRRRLHGPRHAEVAESLVNVAVPLYLGGDYDGAEALYREALAMRLALLGEDHLDVAATRNRLALLLRRRGRLEAAEVELRRALATYRKVLDEHHPEVATVLGNLGNLLVDRRDYPAAERLYQEVLASKRARLGRRHPDTAIDLSNLAYVYEVIEPARAEPLYREALAILREAHGHEHPRVAYVLTELGILRGRRGEADAEALLREALAMDRRLLGDEHPDVALAQSALAVVLREQGDLGAAVPLHQDALETWRRALGDEHVKVGIAACELAETLRLAGDPGAAEPRWREALAIFRAAASPAQPPQLAAALLGLGGLLVDTGRPAEAEPLLREALRLAIAEGGRPGAAALRGEAQALLGAALVALGRADEGGRLLREGHRGLAEEHGERHRKTRRAAGYLAALPSE